MRKLRVQHGLSQSELAARCQRLGWDASREIINHIEMRIRLVREYELVALAKAINVSPLKLLPSETDAFRKLSKGTSAEDLVILRKAKKEKPTESGSRR